MTAYKGKRGKGAWNIRAFPHELRNKMKSRAVAEGRSLPELLTEAIEKFLGEQQ